MNTDDFNARVAQFVEQGLTPKLAKSVVLGQISFSDAIAVLATEAEAKRLTKRHGFNRALAIQIIKGQADLKQQLSKLKFNKYREENGGRCVLEIHEKSGQPILVATTGRTFITGIVEATSPFEVSLRPEDGEVVQLHKLQIKYAYQPEHVLAVRKEIGRDSKRAADPVSPALKPQNRFHISDTLLFQAHKKKGILKIKLVEGEVLRARLSWFSKYQMAVFIDEESELVIFRHALLGVRAI